MIMTHEGAYIIMAEWHRAAYPSHQPDGRATLEVVWLKGMEGEMASILRDLVTSALACDPERCFLVAPFLGRDWRSTLRRYGLDGVFGDDVVRHFDRKAWGGWSFRNALIAPPTTALRLALLDNPDGVVFVE